MGESDKLIAKNDQRSSTKSLSDWAARFLIVAAGLSLNDVFSRAFGVGQLATPAMFAASLALLANINYRIFSLPALLFFGTIASYIGIGLIFSLILGITGSSTSYVFSFISTVAIVLGLSNYIVNTKSRKAILELIVFTRNVFLCSSVLTIATPILGKVLTHNSFAPDGRFRGVFSNPNEAGMVAVIAWLLCVSFPFKNRSIFYISILTPIVAAVLTLSKSCILILIILVAYKAFNLRHPKRTMAASLAAGLAVVVIGKIEYFTSSAFIQYSKYLTGAQSRRMLEISSILSGNVNSTTTTGRTDLWKIALTRIYDDFPLGGGLGSYHNIVGGIASEGVWLGTHNLYIMLLGESGPAPLLFLISMVVICVSRAMKLNGQMRDFLILSWIILVLQWMSSHNGLEHRWLMVFLGLALGLAIRLDGKVRGRPPAERRAVGNTFRAGVAASSKDPRRSA